MQTPKHAPIITLTTDFGLSDTYVGVMKGVILGIAPEARLVDLTHDIAPQNILEASVRLEAAIDYFPNGTIHLVVVDPGVGSDRAAIVVQTARASFVAPDNGVLTLPLLRQSAHHLVKLGEAAQGCFLSPVSATFHGRDVFAPVAAHLAAGLPLSELGACCRPDELVFLAVPEARSESASAGARLQVPILYSDRFGNLITALTPEKFRSWQHLLGRGGDPGFNALIVVQAGDWRWQGLVLTYASAAEGEPLAYWGSGGRLEIAIHSGSALRNMGLSRLDSIYLNAP